MRLTDGVWLAAVSSSIVTLAGCQITTTKNAPPAKNAVTQPALSSCNVLGDSAIVKIQVPGHPFDAIATQDGCWIFVSLPREGAAMRFASNPAIAVLQRSGGDIRLVRTVSLNPPMAGGIVVTHDGKLTVVADGPVVTFIDTERLIAAGANPVLGSIRDGNNAGSIYLTVTKDDALLFVSDESLRQVTVIDLSKARQTGFRQDSIIGRIPVGISPVGLALSEDQKHLFITSEVWPREYGWPLLCPPEGNNKTLPPRPEGAVSIVDVDRARVQPSQSVIGVIAAACSPVRAVLSPDNNRLYVSARGSNSLLIFDTARVIGDITHAQPLTVPVGTAPVGVEVINDGRELVIANSNRFSGGGGSHLSVIDASKVDRGGSAVEGTVPAGLFARELHVTADGKALLVTDYDSGEIEVIAVDSLR